jgi:hypothetical protein
MCKWQGLGSHNGKSRIRFCPKCGSTNLKWLSGLPHLWPYIECIECGHRGIYLTGDRDLIAAVREGYLRKKPEIDGEVTHEEDNEEA